MVAVIDMPVNLIPQMDDAQFKRETDKLQKLLHSATRGAHERFRAGAATWSVMAVKRGMADTTRAAMQSFLATTGGDYTPFQRGLARSAGVQGASIYKQQIAMEKAHRSQLISGAKQTESERLYDTKEFTEKRFLRQDTAQRIRDYKDLRLTHMRYLRGGATQADWNKLNVQTIKLDNAVQGSIRRLEKNGKDVPKYLRQTASNTKVLREQVGKPGNVLPPTTPLGTLGSLGLKALGVGSLVGLVSKVGKFVWNQVKASAQRGQDLIGTTAAYGRFGAGYATMRQLKFGMSEEDARSPQLYAADFRERMMYGEVSDKEWIALSQMGEYGRFIMSGGGERDPEKAARLLDQYIKSVGDDPAALARLRRNLRWTGQSYEQMKMRMPMATPAEMEEWTAWGDEAALQDVSTGIAAYRVQADWERAKRNIGGKLGSWGGRKIASMSYQDLQAAMGTIDATGLGTPEERAALKARLQEEWDSQSWSRQLQTQLNDRVFNQSPQWVQDKLRNVVSNTIGTQNVTITQNINTNDPESAANQSVEGIRSLLQESTQRDIAIKQSILASKIGQAR